MRREDIENDEKFQNLLDSRELTDKAASNYLIAITQYCNLHRMTPTELINEAYEDEDKRVRRSERRIKKKLIKFRKYLKDEGYEATYARTLMTIVRTFYNEDDIVLPKVSMKKFVPRKKTEDDIPGRDHINKALKHSNIMYRAIILLMSSSGLGSKEVRNLTYGEFFKAIKDYLKIPELDPSDISNIIKLTKDKSIIVQWDIIRSKRNTSQITCSSPESTKAILEYLETKPPESFDDPLFMSRGRKKIKDNTMVVNFQIINDRCGFPKVGSTRFFHAHAMRTFFASTALEHGMKKEYVDWSIGHTLNNNEDPYFKQKKAASFAQYQSIVEHLTIENVEKTTIEIDNPKMQKILEQKDEEIASLRKSLANIDRKVDEKIDASTLVKMLTAESKLDLNDGKNIMPNKVDLVKVLLNMINDKG